MSFADRVIRQRRNAGLVPVQQEYTPKDGTALAAEHLELRVDVEEQKIWYPRASSLHDACMRMHVIGAQNDVTMKGFASVRVKLLFGIGRAVQEWIQNTPHVLGDRRRGWWRCLACNRVVYFGGPPRKPCSNCKARPEAIVYHEHAMKLPAPWMMTGHPDMFLEKDTNVYRVLEIKTIKGEEFDKLKGPLAQHDWQIQSYMWGCELDTKLPVPIDSSVGYVMYVSKKYSTKELPFKMFTVQRNEALLGRIKDKVMAFTDGYLNYPNRMPEPLEECRHANWSNWRAKDCPTGKMCIKFFEETT